VKVVPWGPVAILGAVVGGILAGHALGPGAAVAPLVAGGAALAAVALVKGDRRRLALAGVAMLVLASALTQRALHGLVDSPLTPLVDARQQIDVRAALVDDPAGGRWDARALAAVLAFRERDGPWRGVDRRVLVTASADVASRLRVLEAGDHVVVRGWLEPLVGFDARARWLHAIAALHATELVDASGPTSPLVRVANAIRARVLAGADRLAPVDRALLSGFLVGDTRALPYDLTSEFRDAGLSHLLAVSGENVAFVLALFAPVFRRVSLRARFVTGLAVLVLFGTMTRWEPSVVRAIAMAAIAMTAALVGRPTHGLRILTLAVTVLLLVDPFLLHSVGFGLSCGASLGIVLFARPIASRLRGPAWMRETLGVTAAAQIGVAPVLIPVFGSMPLVALPANLLAVPLAGPLTMWGLVAGVVAGLVGHGAPAFAALIQLPTVGLLHAVMGVAQVASRVPVAVDGRSVWAIIAIAALLAAAAALQRARGHSRLQRARP
jgi:competence protein ComEC